VEYPEDGIFIEDSHFLRNTAKISSVIRAVNWIPVQNNNQQMNNIATIFGGENYIFPSGIMIKWGSRVYSPDKNRLI